MIKHENKVKVKEESSIGEAEFIGVENQDHDLNQAGIFYEKLLQLGANFQN